MKPVNFVYGLQALLRKRHADLDGARAQLVAAERQLETRQDELREQLDHVRQLEQQRRELTVPGAVIDVGAATRLQQSLTVQRAEGARRTDELERARAGEQQTLARLREAHRSVKVIERHREQTAAAHRAEQAHDAQLQVDELYLLGMRSLRSAERAGPDWTTAATAAPGSTNAKEENEP